MGGLGLDQGLVGGKGIVGLLRVAGDEGDTFRRYRVRSSICG